MLNNEIGRGIGDKKTLSQKELAAAVLDEQETNGLWTVKEITDKKGSRFEIQIVKLSADILKDDRKLLQNLNDNGYTDEQAKRKKERSENECCTAKSILEIFMRNWHFLTITSLTLVIFSCNRIGSVQDATRINTSVFGAAPWAICCQLTTLLSTTNNCLSAGTVWAVLTGAIATVSGRSATTASA